jgi:hypothetical protein
MSSLRGSTASSKRRTYRLQVLPKHSARFEHSAKTPRTSQPFIGVAKTRVVVDSNCGFGPRGLASPARVYPCESGANTRTTAAATSVARVHVH